MQEQAHLARNGPVVILGGGLTGLAASIASGAEIYEAEGAVGGIASSDHCEGFAFDRGIHVMQGMPARIRKLLDDAGVRLNVRSRRAFIHSHGTFTPYPFQVNTAGMPFGVRARCVMDFLTRPRGSRPENYEEWIYQSVGRGFAEKFLIPYSEKFWTVHPREMTHEWTGNRVPQPSTLQVIRGALWSRQTRIGTNSEFEYPSHAPGYGSIAEALRSRAETVHCGHRASRLDAAGHRLHFENGAVVSYGQLISTIPLPELVRICPEAPEEVRKAAALLRTNSIVVVNLGIARPRLNDWHWVHFPEPGESFFRISFPNNFAENVAPAGMSSISAEVAYSPERPIDKAGIVERVVEDLRRVRVLRPEDRVAFSAIRDIPYGYCIHDFHRKAAVRTVRNWLLERDVIATGRYGLWNYFWSHEAMMSGLQAGEKARATSTMSRGHSPKVPFAAD